MLNYDNYHSDLLVVLTQFIEVAREDCVTLSTALRVMTWFKLWVFAVVEWVVQSQYHAG